MSTYSAHHSTVVVTLTTGQGADLVALAGHVDLNTADHVRERVLGAAEFTQPRLVLDLTPLEFIDSSGIGMLVLLIRALRARGCTLEVVTGTTHQRKLLRIAGIDQVVPVHERLEDALGEAPGSAASAG